VSTTYNNARNGNRKVAVRVDDADHGSSNTAVAELRTVVPDGVGIIDGDNKGHVRWGGHVAGVDAVRGRMAWLAEAGLRDRVVLFDDILILALSLAHCAGQAVCSIPGETETYLLRVTYTTQVVKLDHISLGSSHAVGLENKAAIADIDDDGLGLCLGRQAREAKQDGEGLHHDGRLVAVEDVETETGLVGFDGELGSRAAVGFL